MFVHDNYYDDGDGIELKLSTCYFYYAEWKTTLFQIST